MTERRVVAIRGIVQGVGFRPFIHDLATSLDLRGHVRNDRAGVVVDLEGRAESIEGFLAGLQTSSPPLAVIDSISIETAPPASWSGFAVHPSDASGAPTALVSPDAATCDACLAELFDRSDRRYRHPFLSCTHCGPRLTIVEGIPYDRSRTTMSGFPLCAACRREYDDATNRRFHAQAIACHECGPSLAFHVAGAAVGEASGDNALGRAVTALQEGMIVAIKGLGGYHLGCDARNEVAVRRLRERKHREAKPLAIMVRDLAAARTVATISDAEAELLVSAARPIVLLPKGAGGSIAESVAPGMATLGVMLAYTPLHHLLLADTGRPLVMTSGNRSDEPLACADADALDRLGGVADCFLMHDRRIATRCDDSVVRVVRGGPSFVRRSRGHAPRPLRLGLAFATPVLALGGHLKNTFCIGRGKDAFLSHHIGDLDHPEALRALRDGVAHYQRLFGIDPLLVAHDLHPDYATTRLADAMDLPAIAVQHHHAHVAACAAEHGVSGPVLGVAFDGSGAGTDGAVWGGEFLLVNGPRFERLAHLGYVSLPGGEAAVRAPWRMAAAHLFAAMGPAAERLSLPVIERQRKEWPLIQRMLGRALHSPPTSSVGRLFDAVAALVGLRDLAAFEAQAAIELEAVADRSTARSYPPVLREAGGMLIADPGAIVRGVVEDVMHRRGAAEIAGAFHNAVRDLVVTVVAQLVARTEVRRVALTGGVFQNALLLERTADALAGLGYEVLVHRRVPCNDGGLALGQAVVAAAAFTGMEG